MATPCLLNFSFSVMRFVEFQSRRTGRLPEELIFDSKLNTYAHLGQLDQMGIPFIAELNNLGFTC